MILTDWKLNSVNMKQVEKFIMKTSSNTCAPIGSDSSLGVSEMEDMMRILLSVFPFAFRSFNNVVSLLLLCAIQTNDCDVFEIRTNFMQSP